MLRNQPLFRFYSHTAVHVVKNLQHHLIINEHYGIEFIELPLALWISGTTALTITESAACCYPVVKTSNVLGDRCRGLKHSLLTPRTTVKLFSPRDRTCDPTHYHLISWALCSSLRNIDFTLFHQVLPSYMAAHVRFISKFKVYLLFLQ